MNTVNMLYIFMKKSSVKSDPEKPWRGQLLSCAISPCDLHFFSASCTTFFFFNLASSQIPVSELGPSQDFGIPQVKNSFARCLVSTVFVFGFHAWRTKKTVELKPWNLNFHYGA